MFVWRKKRNKFSRKQIAYEQEQLFILRQGFEQGYAIQASLQCMVAFAQNTCWQRINTLVNQGEDISVLLDELQFRPKTIKWLSGSGEGTDLTQAIEKTLQLLRWELQMRNQLQKTFTYPGVMLILLVVFGTGFSLFIFPQLEFLPIQGSVWLFDLPKFLIILVGFLAVIFGSTSLWWWKASWQQRFQVWRLCQHVKICQIWSCLRLAAHCQLGLLQGNTLLAIFTTNNQQSIFNFQLNQMQQGLLQGQALQQVMVATGFTDPTWLSFFQWQPTNQQILIASEFYWQHAFRQLQQTIEKWCQIGQTLCFLAIGVILLQFYLALFLPIFDITTQI